MKKMALCILVVVFLSGCASRSVSLVNNPQDYSADFGHGMKLSAEQKGELVTVSVSWYQRNSIEGVQVYLENDGSQVQQFTISKKSSLAQSREIGATMGSGGSLIFVRYKTLKPGMYSLKMEFQLRGERKTRAAIDIFKENTGRVHCGHFYSFL